MKSRLKLGMRFWLGGLFMLALVAQASALWAGPATSKAATNVATGATKPSAIRNDDDKRARDLVCSMSVFFSVDREDKFKPNVTMEGRGLVSCRSDQGFTSEFPVLAELEATLPPALLKRPGEIAFSGNTSQFVVVRGEPNELEDSYVPRATSWNNPDSPAPRALLRGLRHDVIIEMKLSAQSTPLSGLEVKGMRLHFDEGAPDLD